MKHKLLNKLWLRVGMIVAIMTTALSGTAWGADETITFSNLYSENTVLDEVVINGNNFSVTFNKRTGGTATQYYTNGTAVRWYGGGTLVVASSTKTISKIEITYTRTDNTISANVGTWNSDTKTWTGSSESVTFTQAGTSGHLRISAIAVTYASASETPTTTTIDDAGITNTDVYVGTDAGSLSAIVKDNNNNVISGATVTWTSSDENVATIAADGAVTLFAAGSVIFTASYEGETGTYQPSSATYEMNVTSSAPYVQPTTIEITPNYTFWGKTAQFSGNDFSELSGSKDNVTLNWTKGDGSTYANTTAMRFYKDNDLTFTAPDGYEIKSIVLVVSGTYNDLTFSPTGYNNTTTTWSGSSETVTMSRPSNASSYATISKFTITIALPSTDPVINAEDVNIAYDATEGSFSYTINNPVQDGSVSIDYASDGDWLLSATENNGTVNFTCEANNTNAERLALVTITYTYGSPSQTVTKEVWVTQAAAPVTYTTIPALYDKATEAGSTATDVLVTFDSWVVSAVSTNGKNVFVTDNAGNGFVIFDNDAGLASTYAVGNTLSGTAVPCSLKLNQGYAQITGLDASDLSISTGGTVSTASIAIESLAGVNTGALVSYNNLTCTVDGSTYTLTDGTTTIQLYTSLYNYTTTPDFVNGHKYNVTGVYQQYGNTKEILPRNADDIEEVVVTTPSITITPATANPAASDVEGTLEITYQNLPITDMTDFDVQFYDAEGNELNGNDEPDWIEVLVAEQDPSIGEGYVVSYTIDANTGAARTAYFKIYALDTETNVVYSNLVTITQAEHVDTNTYTLATAITSGKTYVIASGTSGDVKVMSILQTANNRSPVNGSVYETTLSVQPNVGVAEMIIYGPDANGNYTFYNARYKDKDNNWVDGGYLCAASSGSNYLRTQDTNDMNGKWSISINNDTKVATITAKGNYTRNKMRYNSSNNIFSCYSSGQQDIYLYEKADAAVATTASVTLNSYGYATYATTSALDFLDADAEDVGYSAWQITNANSSTGVITFTQIKGHVEAGTGILLKGTPEATVNLNILPVGGATLGSNILKGTTEPVPLSTAGEAYGLSGNKFVKNSGAGDIPANKAYIPANSIPSSVKAFTFVFDDEDDPTSIQTIDNGQQTTDGAIYNVAGQRLNKMQKGINIVNGKKVLK